MRGQSHSAWKLPKENNPHTSQAEISWKQYFTKVSNYNWLDFTKYVFDNRNVSSFYTAKWKKKQWIPFLDLVLRLRESNLHIMYWYLVLKKMLISRNLWETQTWEQINVAVHKVRQILHWDTSTVWKFTLTLFGKNFLKVTHLLN